MEGNKIKATANVGITSFPDDAENIDTLLLKVDKAMYKSKNSGRHTVTLYSEHE